MPLGLDLRAFQHAYSFELQIQYEVGGERLVHTVRRGKGPFRVAADPCNRNYPDNLPDDEKPSDAKLASAAKATYRTVLVSDFSTATYKLKQVDPDELCSAIRPSVG